MPPPTLITATTHYRPRARRLGAGRCSNFAAGNRLPKITGDKGTPLIKPDLAAGNRLPLHRASKIPSILPAVFMANVRGLRHKMDELTTRLSVDYDIILLCETWLDDSVPDDAISISGYQMFRCDRKSTKTGGGLLAYVRDGVYFNASSINTTLKTQIMRLDLPGFNSLFVFLYHPYWGTQPIHDIVKDQLHDILAAAEASKHVTLCGDINDLRKCCSDIYSAFGLTQIVTAPTRQNNLLDIFATTHPSAYMDPTILPPIDGSDHSSIAITPKQPVVPTVERKLVRRFGPAQYARFRTKLESASWESLYAIDNPAVAADQLQCMIFSIFNESFPFKTVKLKSNRPAWMSVQLTMLLNERDRALSRRQIAKYLALRDKCRIAIRNHKAGHYSHTLTECSTPKSKWRIINEICGRTKSASAAISRSAECLNSDFTSVFMPSDMDDFLIPADDDTILEITPANVYNRLIKQKPKAAGPDGIAPITLKNVADLLAVPLCTIFNRCLRARTMPECWKRANITPVPKKGTQQYRPISVLPVLALIFETVVLRGLIIPNLVKKFDTSQFAFAPGNRCGTNLALTEMRLWSMSRLEHGGVVRMLAIDYTKAFDKLSHKRILEAATDFGLAAPLVLWLKSYLTERMQRVKINNSTSEYSRITSGVPQGSVIAPVLFAMVIDGVANIVREHNATPFLYADDLTIQCHVESDGMSLQHVVNAVSQWSSEKGLTINVSKCQLLDITRSHKPPLTPVTIGDVSVTPVSTMKVLGVTFSSDCRWSHHINDLESRCCRALYFVAMVRKSGASHDTVWQAYNAFCYSIMSYCWPCFCDVPDNIFRKLVLIDKRAQRLSDRTIDVNLRQRLDQQCVKLAKHINSTHPLCHNFVARPNHNHVLRNTSHYQPPRCRTNFMKHSFIKFYAFIP